ncbi:MAG: DUF4878 domain-containing protein [Porphyromonadaceae bacterium]|nr:DUF4878 domain-containing protein [Porphyromonadaceae bacterium]
MKTNSFHYFSFALVLSVAFCCIIGFTSCKHSDRADAEQAAREFVSRAYNHDYDGAAEYATESTKGLLNFIKGLDSSKIDEEGIKSFQFEVVEDSIGESRGWIVYKDKTGSNNRIDLVKQDGKWLVDQKL